MQRIVLINQSSGYLVVDDLNAYCEKYDEVHLICGDLKFGERELNSKVKIRKICKYNKSSAAKRLLTWCWASFQIFFLLLFKYKGWEVVYYTNPPISCFSALLLNNKFRLVEYDIYPDALKTIGIGEKSFIVEIWGRLKRSLYKKASAIYTLSEGMKEVLLKYGSEEKIKVVPLWAASEKFKPIEKSDNVFIKRNGLVGKFIVMYSGNIGYTHSVECLISIAKVMKNDINVQFLIIGDGKKKKEIEADAIASNLTNVTFLPFQDFNMLPYSLTAADIGVITLDENVSKVSVPSKTYNLLAVGAPLLVIAKEDTEMFRLVDRFDVGKCINKAQIEEMAKFIRALNTDASLKRYYSNNSLKASMNFTYKNAGIYLV